MTAVYLFGAILVILLAAVILSPLREGRRPAGEAHGPAAARARKDAAIEALRELEFEFQTGKISDEDYQSLRRRWAHQAIQARDELGEKLGGVPARCGTCGSEPRPGARFCSRCGSPLATDGAEETADA